jgi:hypothetical protein
MTKAATHKTGATIQRKAQNPQNYKEQHSKGECVEKNLP